MVFYFVQKLFHALHLVGMVAWFAGLFYLVRLYVYHQECEEEKSRLAKVAVLKKSTTTSTSPNTALLQGLEARIASYRIMERRLANAIATPAMILTLVAGVVSASLGGYFSQPWMHAKLAFVLLLVGYHHHLLYLRKKLAISSSKHSSKFFRFYNEAATLLLLAIVSLAVFRQLSLAMISSAVLLGFFILTFVVVLSTRRLK